MMTDCFYQCDGTRIKSIVGVFTHGYYFLGQQAFTDDGFIYLAEIVAQKPSNYAKLMV